MQKLSFLLFIIVRNTSSMLMIQEAILIAIGYNYLGAQSDINVWNPPGVQFNDYSSSQIWLLAGLSDKFETIEAGWVVRFFYP